MNLGELPAAEKEMELADNAPQSILLRAEISSGQGNLETAVKHYNEYLLKAPKGEFAGDARKQVALLKGELLTEEQVSKLSPSNLKDYFNFVTSNMTIKWKQNKFPLTVYIPPGGQLKEISNYKPQFATQLRTAFQQWQKETNNQVSFRFVDHKPGADIDCRWVDDSSKLPNKAEGGDAHIQADSLSGIRHAEITILTKPAGKRGTKPMLDSDVHNTALHEIGHSLGLDGHSPNPGDIMYFMEVPGDSVRGLSQRDLATMAHLYRPEVRIRLSPPGSAPNHHAKKD